MSEPGGTTTAIRSVDSSSPSAPSPGSSSPRGVAVSQQALAWATFGALSYAWLGTAKLDHTATWQPMLFLVLNAMPGGMVVEIAKAVGLALVDKIPGRSASRLPLILGLAWVALALWRA